jgi:hypothetical protein
MLVHLPFAIAAGARSARRQLSEGTIEGTAWRQLVRTISNVCDEGGLPTPVSKERGSRLKLKSEFLKMFAAFQSMLPEHLQRYALTDEGLASAISNARKGTRARKN